MTSTINLVVGVAFIVLGLSLFGFGVFFGFFGGLNDGAAVGVSLLLVPGGFAAAAVVIGLSFFVVARLHARSHRWRWWLQVLLPLATFYLAFGLAAMFSVVVERALRR